MTPRIRTAAAVRRTRPHQTPPDSTSHTKSPTECLNDHRSPRVRVTNRVTRPAGRQRYVRLKIDYWHAVEAGDGARTELLASQARALADGLKRAKKQ
jgi:hypothetical protein